MELRLYASATPEQATRCSTGTTAPSDVLLPCYRGREGWIFGVTARASRSSCKVQRPNAREVSMIERTVDDGSVTDGGIDPSIRPAAGTVRSVIGTAGGKSNWGPSCAPRRAQRTRNGPGRISGSEGVLVLQDGRGIELLATAPLLTVRCVEGERSDNRFALDASTGARHESSSITLPRPRASLCHMIPLSNATDVRRHHLLAAEGSSQASVVFSVTM